MHRLRRLRLSSEAQACQLSDSDSDGDTDELTALVFLSQRDVRFPLRENRGTSMLSILFTLFIRSALQTFDTLCPLCAAPYPEAPRRGGPEPEGQGERHPSPARRLQNAGRSGRGAVDRRRCALISPQDPPSVAGCQKSGVSDSHAAPACAGANAAVKDVHGLTGLHWLVKISL